jgi:glutathione peroxidase
MADMTTAPSSLIDSFFILASKSTYAKWVNPFHSARPVADIETARVKASLCRFRAQSELGRRPELSLSLSPDIPLKRIDGQATTIGEFRGKALLIVNVASKCGFTPQYAGLEALHRRFRDRGFSVLGFPCDQFGHQEPGDESGIESFCKDSYDVTFPMFGKIAVNGSNAHPLFAALKREARGLFGTQAIKWNFTKFLVDRNGRVVRRYAPSDKPEALTGDVEATLS